MSRLFIQFVNPQVESDTEIPAPGQEHVTVRLLDARRATAFAPSNQRAACSLRRRAEPEVQLLRRCTEARVGSRR